MDSAHRPCAAPWNSGPGLGGHPGGSIHSIRLADSKAEARSQTTAPSTSFISRSSTSFLPNLPCFSQQGPVLKCVFSVDNNYKRVCLKPLSDHPLRPELRNLVSLFVGSAGGLSPVCVIILDCELVLRGAVPVEIRCARGDPLCPGRGFVVVRPGVPLQTCDHPYGDFRAGKGPGPTLPIPHPRHRLRSVCTCVFSLCW